MVGKVSVVIMVSHRAINKTIEDSEWDIMLFENGEPIGLLTDLSKIFLPVPRNGIELLATMVLVRFGHPTMADQFLRAPAERIWTALAEYRGYPYSRGPIRDLLDLKDMLDFREYAPDLISFARRSREWHDREEFIDYGSQFDDNRVLPVFPIRLPTQVDGRVEIRILDTVGAIRQEGKSMHHCVSSYILPAMRGDLYLLHICLHETQKTNAEATVELRYRKDTGWMLAQAKGPRNSQNSAVEWAKKNLLSLIYRKTKAKAGNDIEKETDS